MFSSMTIFGIICRSSAIRKGVDYIFAATLRAQLVSVNILYQNGKTYTKVLEHAVICSYAMSLIIMRFSLLLTKYQLNMSLIKMRLYY